MRSSWDWLPISRCSGVNISANFRSYIFSFFLSGKGFGISDVICGSYFYDKILEIDVMAEEDVGYLFGKMYDFSEDMTDRVVINNY